MVIKINNMGYNTADKLFIFDFARSTEAKEKSYYCKDVMALARLCINILTKQNLFTPGRYYRGFTTKCDWFLINIGNILKNVEFADLELLSVFKKLLGLNDNFVSISNKTYNNYNPNELLSSFLMAFVRQ